MRFVDIKTCELHYELPAELIAQQPIKPRDAARLMVVHRDSSEIEHRIFSDLPEYLRADDCLVLNKTRVLPARFTARRATGGRISGLFVGEDAPGCWTVLLAGASRVKLGERIELSDPRWSMVLEGRADRGACQVRVEPAEAAFVVLDAVGRAPLPPYIKRGDEEPSELTATDLLEYQTVYADSPGAIAAPTAGMHFTRALMDRLSQDVGVEVAEVVLHVGLGTFQPVEVDDLSDHPMHSEWFDLPVASAEKINSVRERRGRAVAVGTTSVRTIESCVSGGRLTPRSGWTDLLIAPPYAFGATDAMITNFHLPGSTLLALIYAFGGRELLSRAYASAIENRYRFYSYGDAMLIL